MALRAAQNYSKFGSEIFLRAGRLKTELVLDQHSHVATVMRLNIWIVVAVLFALFAVTRYARYQETEHICADDPIASHANGEIIIRCRIRHGALGPAPERCV
jgi:hypothetical protein